MERKEDESPARPNPAMNVRRSLTCGGQKEAGQSTSPSFTTTIAGLEVSNSQLNNKLSLLDSCHQDNLVEIRGMQDKISVLSLENQQMCSALQSRGAKEKQTKRNVRRQHQEVWRLQSALFEFREHWSAQGQSIDQILGPEDKAEEGEMESAS